MPFRDRIEVEFCAGHRLLDYDGNCASPHGHTYRAELIVEGDALNDLGLVFDFHDLRRNLKEWIDEHWDHGFLMNRNDRSLRAALEPIAESKLYLFDQNPSAEIMARELYDIAQKWLGDHRIVVRIWESGRQYGEYGA